jgi:hypothetical protein
MLSVDHLQGTRMTIDWTRDLPIRSTSPDLASVPPRLGRRAAAAFLSLHFFPVSPRTIEAWPIPSRRVNGKALYETIDLITYANQKIDEAAVSRGGRQHHH